MRHGMRKFEVLDEFRKDPSATIRELAARLGISVFTCHYHLTNLEKEGLITRNHFVGNYMGKVPKRQSKTLTTREKVMAAFRSNNVASLKEIAQKVGVSEASVSGHLCALERDGLIKRPRRVWDTRKQASTPNENSKAWVSVQKGAIRRGLGAMRPRKAKDAGALQKRIDQVVAKAEQNGTCFRADYINLKQLSGCKCG